MKKLRNCLLFGFALLGTVAILDLYLQLAEIQTPMETRIDPELGRAYIPNKRIIRFNEGFFMGWANEYGYMGPGIPPNRIDKEKRILLLGDSYVLGHTVFPRHYFGRYLEDGLRKATGEDVHALNFGKADFFFENMYQIYSDYARTFEHDLALFFVAEEDLIPTRQILSDLYPKVKLVGDSIVIDRSFRFNKTYRLYKAIEPVLTRSSVLRLVFNTYRIISSRRWVGVVFDKFASALEPDGHDTDAGPDLPRALPALSRAMLRELAMDPRNVLVLKMPVPSELLSELKTFGMPIIDLGSYLESLRSEGNDPYYWPVTRLHGGHWNHAANVLIGRFLSDQIISGRTFWPANRPPLTGK